MELPWETLLKGEGKGGGKNVEVRLIAEGIKKGGGGGGQHAPLVLSPLISNGEKIRGKNEGCLVKQRNFTSRRYKKKRENRVKLKQSV